MVSVAAPAEEYNAYFVGRPVPEVKKVYGEFTGLPLAKDRVKVVTDPGAAPGVAAGAEYLHNRLGAIIGAAPKQFAEGEVPATRILLGIVDSPLFIGVELPELPRYGYSLRLRRLPDGGCDILAVGSDARGAFYAAVTLVGMAGTPDGRPILEFAEVDDFPDWTNCYYGGSLRGGAETYLRDVAARKITGYGWQLNNDFDRMIEFAADPASDPELAEKLDGVRQAAEVGVVDFMVQICPYRVSGRRPIFDISKEDDVVKMIGLCRMFAQIGFKHIDIYFDDTTPAKNGEYTFFSSEEAAHFGNALGTAHGYLMKRIVEALRPEFPEVEFAICPAPYSNDHLTGPGYVKYLTDLEKTLPPEVYVVWTGPNVCSPVITEADYERFHSLLPTHRLMIFDNSNNFEYPIPLFNTVFFAGLKDAVNGQIFLNCNGFDMNSHQPYLLTVNDYLWNQAGYNRDRSGRAAVTLCWGRGIYDVLMEYRTCMTRILKKFESGDSNGLADDIAEAEKTLADLRPRLNHYSPDVDFLDRYMNPARAMLTEKRAEAVVPLLADAAVIDGIPDDAVWASAAVIPLSRSDGAAPALPTEVRAFVYDNALYLRFSGRTAVDPAKLRFNSEHEDAVYQSSDIFEIFVQPGGDSRYVHYAFDMAGNRFDESGMGGSDTLDPDWTLKVTLKDGEFTAEMKITAISLECFQARQLRPGSAWKINIHRINSEVVSWSQSFGGFHVPQFFGRFVIR